MWKKPLAWQVMLYMGIGSLLFYGPLSWLPEIYQSRGVDVATAGYLLLVMNFLGMVGSLLSPSSPEGCATSVGWWWWPRQ